MPTTISLGFEVPDYSQNSGGVSPGEKGASKQPTKTAYPTMTIPGNKSLARSLRPGQKITATVTFCVAEIGIRDRKGDEDDGPVDTYSGTRVELEAESITFDNLKIEEAGEEVDGATAFRTYMGKKKAKASDEGDAFGGGED